MTFLDDTITFATNKYTYITVMKTFVIIDHLLMHYLYNLIQKNIIVIRVMICHVLKVNYIIICNYSYICITYNSCI